MIQLEIWGDYACFSRPELKIERVSYDVPTPSAARGIVEAIYFHPGLKWSIDKIYVLSPIKFTNIRRNEVKNKISGSNVREYINGKRDELYLAASKEIVQRAAMVLQDVHFVIQAHFYTPYLGCREFSAYFRKWPGGPIPAIKETRDLGFMLYDMDYTDPQNITPMFFHAKLENGVLNTADCEVFR